MLCCRSLAWLFFLLWRFPSAKISSGSVKSLRSPSLLKAILSQLRWSMHSDSGHFAWSSKRFQGEPLSRFPMLSSPQRTAFGISVTSHTRPSSGDVREAGWPWRWEDWLFPGYKCCITIIANLIILLWKWRPEIVETSHFYRLFFFENVFFPNLLWLEDKYFP